MRLVDKVVIVTGAANGIGAAAARRFAAEGARLLLVDQDAAALQRVAAEVGDAAAALTCDVVEDGSALRFVEEASRRFGRVDGAVLNAGIEGTVGPLASVGAAVFDRVMAVNARSVWLGLAALMPAMAERGGSIVITSSVAGLRGSPQLAAYAASKHAVVGLMRSAALEGAAHRIRVNTVNPGPTQTRMIRDIDGALAVRGGAGGRADRVPLRRYGEADEIVSLMLFLLSDEASYCTGGTYLADGGSMSGASA